MTGAILLLLAAAGVAVVRHSVGFIRFRARIRAALDATPDIRWQRWTGRGMAVVVSGYALELDLIPTYLFARLRRPTEQALLAELQDSLRRRIPPGAVPPLPLVRDRILPVLKRADALPPSRGYLPDNVLVRRFLDGEVAVAYVIEGQFRMTYITRGMLQAWDLRDVVHPDHTQSESTPETPGPGQDTREGPAAAFAAHAPEEPAGEERLHTLALANLGARTRHVLEEIGGPRREYVALDGYDAARLLVADLLVPDDVTDPVFAIPHEHACLIAPEEQAGALRASAARAYRTATLPLTPALYRWAGTHPERIG